MVAPLSPDRARLAAVREALPAVGAGIFLNTAAAGPIPAETARAMAEIAAGELAVGRSHVHDPLETIERVSEARAAVAAVLAADLDAVALTNGTAHGIGVALSAVGWRAGDRAVIGVPAGNGRPGWPYGALDALGVAAEVIAIDAEQDDDALVGAFQRALLPGSRLVALPHVLETTGQRLPVARIAAAARSRNALVLVDGTQSVGAVPVDPDDLGADFLAFPAERWLLGPAGLGALWCGPAVLGLSRKLYPGGFADPFSGGPPEGRARGLASFEDASGTWSRAAVVGMARSCGWLSMHVGLAWAWARAGELAAWAATTLAATPGVTVLTPRDRMATIITFRIAGWPADLALDELGARVFAIAGLVAPLGAIRISVGAFNSEDEVARFVEAVALLATHTPQSIPPRRTLNMLP